MGYSEYHRANAWALHHADRLSARLNQSRQELGRAEGAAERAPNCACLSGAADRLRAAQRQLHDAQQALDDHNREYLRR